MSVRSPKRKRRKGPGRDAKELETERSTAHRTRRATIDRQGLGSAIHQLETQYFGPILARIRIESKRLDILKSDPQVFDRFGPLGYLKLLATTRSDASFELDERVITRTWQKLRGASLTLWKRVRWADTNIHTAHASDYTAASASASASVSVSRSTLVAGSTIDDPFIRLAPPFESDPSPSKPSSTTPAHTAEHTIAKLLNVMERWSKASQDPTRSQIDPWSTFISLGDSISLQDDTRAWTSVKNLVQTLVSRSPCPSESPKALSNQQRAALNDPSLIRFLVLILSDATLREWMETATFTVSNPRSLSGSSFHSSRRPRPRPGPIDSGGGRTVTLAPICLIDPAAHDPDSGDPSRQEEQGDAGQGASRGFVQSSTHKVWKTFCASLQSHSGRATRPWDQGQGDVDIGRAEAEARAKAETRHVLVLLAVRCRSQQQDGEEEQGVDGVDGVDGGEQASWKWCLVDCRWDSMSNDIARSREKKATIYGCHQRASDIEGLVVDFLNEMDGPGDQSGQGQAWKMETIPLLSPDVHDGSSGPLALVLVHLALSLASSTQDDHDRPLTRSDLLHAISAYKDFADLGSMPSASASASASAETTVGSADDGSDLAVLSRKILLAYIVDLFNMRLGILELWEACRSGFFMGGLGGQQGHIDIGTGSI